MEPDRWLGVELRHLTALRAIAETGSFGRAATRLGYTQSAVSQQIATLERAVGERLLERPGGPRPVSLTEAGRVLLRHAEAIVARLDAARADLEALASGQAGPLRVGTYQSVGARLLPQLLRGFGERWPDVDIRLTESADDDRLLAGVERGELDLAFAVLPLPDGPFDFVELMRDPYVLVVPAGSELALAGRVPTLREIAAQPLIGFRQCRTVVQVDNTFRSRGLDPNVVFRSDDNGTVQGMAAAGMGSALVPRLTVDPNDPRIAVLDVDPKLPPRVLALAWHRDRYRTPASRAFVDEALALCAGFAPAVAA
ncbi:MAG: LysR family transcriptional regulator [Gaiellaceae bacterium]